MNTRPDNTPRIRPRTSFGAWAGALCAVGLLVPCVGCMSFSVRDSLRAARSPRHEFHKVALDTNRPIRGACVGKIETNRTAYLCCQFTNVLAGGKVRCLDVLLSVESTGTNLVTESTAPQKEQSEFFLLLHRLRAGEAPEVYFRRHYPGEDARNYASRSFHLCVYEDSRWNLCLVRENPSTGQLEWGKSQAQFDLAWTVRNRGRYRLAHLKYLYAVPFDLITFPFQLLEALDY